MLTNCCGFVWLQKKNFMLFMYFMVNFYIAVNDYDFNTEQQL